MDTQLQFKNKHEAQKKTKKTTQGLGGLHAKNRAICMCETPKYDSVQITQALFLIVLIGQGCIF